MVMAGALMAEALMAGALMVRALYLLSCRERSGFARRGFCLRVPTRKIHALRSDGQRMRLGLGIGMSVRKWAQGLRMMAQRMKVQRMKAP